MSDVPTDETMTLLKEAIAAFPQCASLWCLRGNMIQLYDEPEPEVYSLEDARSSYERAVQVDPTHHGAWAELGFYHDCYTQDFAEAERCFREALRVGESPDAIRGLARVLAQTDRVTEALHLLNKERCRFDDVAGIVELRAEIEAGDWSD